MLDTRHQGPVNDQISTMGLRSKHGHGEASSENACGNNYRDRAMRGSLSAKIVLEDAADELQNDTTNRKQHLRKTLSKVLCFARSEKYADREKIIQYSGSFETTNELSVGSPLFDESKQPSHASSDKLERHQKLFSATPNCTFSSDTSRCVELCSVFPTDVKEVHGICKPAKAGCIDRSGISMTLPGRDESWLPINMPLAKKKSLEKTATVPYVLETKGVPEILNHATESQNSSLIVKTSFQQRREALERQRQILKAKLQSMKERQDSYFSSPASSYSERSLDLSSSNRSSESSRMPPTSLSISSLESPNWCQPSSPTPVSSSEQSPVPVPASGGRSMEPINEYKVSVANPVEADTPSTKHNIEELKLKIRAISEHHLQLAVDHKLPLLPVTAITTDPSKTTNNFIEELNDEQDWGLLVSSHAPIFYSGEVTYGNVPHGMGTIKFLDGDTYSGPFRNGQMHGPNGVYVWKVGSVYKGAFDNNLQHGHGEYRIEGGRRYIGGFEHGQIHGYGEAYNRDGSIYHKGQWENDKPAHTYVPFIYEPSHDIGESSVCASLISENLPVASDVSFSNKHSSLSMYDTSMKDIRAQGAASSFGDSDSVRETVDETRSFDVSSSPSTDTVSEASTTESEIEHRSLLGGSQHLIRATSIQLGIKRLRKRIAMLETERGIQMEQYKSGDSQAEF